MQPLGSPELVAAYHARISDSHDYSITADILDMEENVVGPAKVVDGQVNLLGDAVVHRTAQVTLSDPDRSLGLDGSSVFSGSAAADRMLRIRHTVSVPGFGDVTCTPFVGPFVRVNRNGDTIDVEAQDKTGLVINGTRPYVVPRGMSSMLAIRALLTNLAGESRFRLPSGIRFRLLRPYSVGWADESSVWVRVQQIAHDAGMQAFYSCDGYVTVRPYSTTPVLEFGQDGIPSTSVPASDSDFTTIVNYARVEAGKIVAVLNQDDIDSTHPFSPTSLGRNGVPRYLPALAEVDGPIARPQRPGTTWQGTHRPASKAQWTKYVVEMEKFDASVRAATTRANASAAAMLKAGLTQQVNLNWSCVPVFHLDFGDPIRLTTDEGSAVLRLNTASIPLRPTAEGMSVGLVKPVSRPGRIRG
jgi:hypothetical protein